MQISNYKNTSSYYSPKFKGSDEEWNIIGIDTATEDTRKYLRQHYEEKILPYSHLYTKELPSTTEYMFIHYPQTVHQIRPIKLKGFQNAYSGMSLIGKINSLKELKNAGIETVINLSCHGLNYEDDAKEAGLNHIKCDFDDLMKETPESVDNFVNAIANMKKDNFYIGCILGTKVTNKFLHIADYFINPDQAKEIINLDEQIKAENLLEQMSSEQKKRMNFTEKDEEAFSKRIRQEMKNYH